MSKQEVCIPESHRLLSGLRAGSRESAGDGSACMGLGTGLWKLKYCKTKMPFRALILIINMVLDGVVPTSKETAYKFKSLCCLKEILKGQWSDMLVTRTEASVSANKRI